MTFDYKKYSLENLENWIHDAMSAAEATPQEIYDVIKGVVEDNYYTYKKQASDAYELLALLNGNGVGHISDATSRGNKIHQEIEDILVGIHDDCRIPCDMEALQYTDEEMDAMTAAAEEELISKGYFKDNGFWRKSKIWTVEIQMDGLTGDAFIPIPDELSDVVGWNVDDELEWCDNKNGSYIIRKVTK
jgi:hypothetical protein